MSDDLDSTPTSQTIRQVTCESPNVYINKYDTEQTIQTPIASINTGYSIDNETMAVYSNDTPYHSYEYTIGVWPDIETKSSRKYNAKEYRYKYSIMSGRIKNKTICKKENRELGNKFSPSSSSNDINRHVIRAGIRDSHVTIQSYSDNMKQFSKRVRGDLHRYSNTRDRLVSSNELDVDVTADSRWEPNSDTMFDSQRVKGGSVCLYQRLAAAQESYAPPGFTEQVGSVLREHNQRRQNETTGHVTIMAATRPETRQSVSSGWNMDLAQLVCDFGVEPRHLKVTFDTRSIGQRTVHVSE